MNETSLRSPDLGLGLSISDHGGIEMMIDRNWNTRERYDDYMICDNHESVIIDRD